MTAKSISIIYAILEYRKVTALDSYNNTLCNLKHKYHQENASNNDWIDDLVNEEEALILCRKREDLENIKELLADFENHQW